MPTKLAATGSVYLDPNVDKDLQDRLARIERHGRFQSSDPFAGHADIPGSLNRYGYVINHPVNSSDRFGLDGSCPGPGCYQVCSSVAGQSVGCVTYCPQGAPAPPGPSPEGVYALLALMFGRFDSPGREYEVPVGREVPEPIGEPPVPRCSDIFTLQGVKLKVTGNYLEPREGPLHWGMDFRAPIGTPLILNISGTVTADTRVMTGFGYTLVVQSGGQNFLFAHLLGPPLFNPGQSISAGTLVGYTGASTGSSKIVVPPHLHFERFVGSMFDNVGDRLYQNIAEPCRP